jgi:2-isopropylmalate synthase
MVSNLTGLLVQRNKAIVGQNAFAHEAGIHVHGVQQYRRTYEIMDPRDVGISESTIVLGKHTGRHGYRRRIERMGYRMTDAQLDEIVARCKRLADAKKEILDADLEAILEEVLGAAPKVWDLDVLHFSGGTGTIPTATVKMTNADGRTARDAATGDGPVDAIYSALQRITGVELALEDFKLRALPGGQQALGEVTITVRHDGQTMHGRGVSTDIVEAAAKALLNVINRILAAEKAAAAPKPKKKRAKTARPRKR